MAQDGDDTQRTEACAVIQAAWDELAAKVIAKFVNNGFKAGDVTLLPGYRMQYMGQLNELEITLPIAKAAAAHWQKITDAFEDTDLSRQGAGHRQEHSVPVTQEVRHVPCAGGRRTIAARVSGGRRTVRSFTFPTSSPASSFPRAVGGVCYRPSAPAAAPPSR
ncbi:hypothetical protein ACFSVK_07360 [Azorhizophilus paspali]|uniref:hypothetical protein n=1 Tax=Azorhizophilus paspali TaxID=69963 RepID=UPI003628FC58